MENCYLCGSSLGFNEESYLMRTQLKKGMIYTPIGHACCYCVEGECKKVTYRLWKGDVAPDRAEAK